MRGRTRRNIAVGVLIASILFYACGGDDEEAGSKPSPEGSESPFQATGGGTGGSSGRGSEGSPGGGGTKTSPPTDPSGADTPELAAQGLYDSWWAGDMSGATGYGTQEAIDELFGYPPSDMQFSPPCQELEDQVGVTCFFYYEGGGLNMVVGDSDAFGAFVTDVYFIAD